MIHFPKFFTKARRKEPPMGQVKKDIAVSPIATSMNCKVHIDYTNYRGERAWRTVVPHNIFHGTTEHHITPQWLMTAWDIDKRCIRVFAMADIHQFKNDNADRMRIDVVAAPAPQDTPTESSEHTMKPWPDLRSKGFE